MRLKLIVFIVLFFTCFIISGSNVFAKDKALSVILKIGSTDFRIASSEERAYPSDGDLKEYSKFTPLIKENKVYVPARFLVEIFGGKTEWDSASKKAAFSIDDKKVMLSPGDNSAVVNGQPETMAAAPFMNYNELFVPLRDVAKYLGLTVFWISCDQSVEISNAKITYASEDVRKKVSELDNDALQKIMQKIIDIHNDEIKYGFGGKSQALVNIRFIDIKYPNISKGNGNLIVCVQYKPDPDGLSSTALMVLTRASEYSIKYLDLSHKFIFSTHDVDSDGIEEIFVEKSYSYRYEKKDLIVLKYEGDRFKNIFNGGYSYSYRSFYESDFSYSLIPDSKNSKFLDIIFSINNKEINHEGETVHEGKPAYDPSHPLKDEITFKYNGTLYVPDKSVNGYSNFKFVAYDLKYSVVPTEPLKKIVLDNDYVNAKNIQCDGKTIKFYYKDGDYKIRGILEYNGAFYDLGFLKGSAYFDYDVIQDNVVTEADLDGFKGNEIILLYTGEGTNTGNTVAIGINADGVPVKLATAWNLKILEHKYQEQVVSLNCGISSRRLLFYRWDCNNIHFGVSDINESTGCNYSSMLEPGSDNRGYIIEVGNYDAVASKIENIQHYILQDDQLLFL
ncbi:MAG TPA: stalk domain-containing protein [Clostridia bacterium]